MVDRTTELASSEAFKSCSLCTQLPLLSVPPWSSTRQSPQGQPTVHHLRQRDAEMRNRCPICFVFGTRESPGESGPWCFKLGERTALDASFSEPLTAIIWIWAAPLLGVSNAHKSQSFRRRRRKHGRSEFPLVKLMASRAKVPWIEFIECTERTETIGIIYCIIIIIISNQSNLSKRFFKLHHVLKPKLCTWKHYGRFLEDHDIEADSIQGTSCWPPPSHCHTSDRSGWCHSHVALPHPVPHRTWRCKQSQHTFFLKRKSSLAMPFFQGLQDLLENCQQDWQMLLHGPHKQIGKKCAWLDLWT